jgi:O-methyltransferase
MNQAGEPSSAPDSSKADDLVERAHVMTLDSLRGGNSPEGLYLELMKKCLTRLLFPEQYQQISSPKSRVRRVAWRNAQRLLARFDLNLVKLRAADSTAREEGLDWPASAETMIGLKRLDNLQYCIVDVLTKGIEGDFIETGVWRGGAAIFMRAVLKAYGVRDRRVWLADSFQGLPKPNAKVYPADARDTLWQIALLAVSLDEVKENFRRYNLLDDQVHFLEGWFRDTLPIAPVERLALLRLDGDLYESTILALTHLYPKLSLGGYVIIDDYALPNCRLAVEDFRSNRCITEQLQSIDQHACYWQRRI